MARDARDSPQPRTWLPFFAKKSDGEQQGEEKKPRREWTMGILEDKETIEVPGMLYHEK